MQCKGLRLRLGWMEVRLELGGITPTGPGAKGQRPAPSAASARRQVTVTVRS